MIDTRKPKTAPVRETRDLLVLEPEETHLGHGRCTACACKGYVRGERRDGSCSDCGHDYNRHL